MKQKAFLQAALILLLLGISWLVLFLRMPKENPTEVTPSIRDNNVVVSNDPSPGLTKPESVPEPATIFDNPEQVPGDWSEWWDYLAEQESPQGMRAALEALRNLIITMPPEQAATWLLGLINSGADMRTGLAFQLQGDGSLRAASSLQAYLLDLLHMVDPERAGSLARKALIEEGTHLAPDVYVIHMRNFAKWPGTTEKAAIPFLQGKLESLINHKPWTEAPTAAVAEAMDVAVYTNGIQFVPALAGLMEDNRPQMLRHASALALERLVDRTPLEVLALLLEDMPAQPQIASARAGYFARLNPGSQEAGELLDAYLSSPALSRAEAVRFLESFPNLNQSLSHNLLSTNISNTQPGGYVEWYRNALDQIQEWQNDENMVEFQEILDSTEIRLRKQLTGEPLP